MHADIHKAWRKNGLDYVIYLNQSKFRSGAHSIDSHPWGEDVHKQSDGGGLQTSSVPWLNHNKKCLKGMLSAR